MPDRLKESVGALAPLGKGFLWGLSSEIASSGLIGKGSRSPHASCEGTTLSPIEPKRTMTRGLLLASWIGGFLGMLFSGCTSQKAPLPSNWDALRKAIPTQEARGYLLRWTGAEGARGFIRADRLSQELRQDTLWWILRGHVEAEWASSGQTGTNRLRCEEAHLLPQTGLLKAYRSIQVTTAAGEILETDELGWDRSTGRLWAPGWVRLQTPKEEVRGWGLESTQNLRTYKLRRIQGRLQSPVS